MIIKYGHGRRARYGFVPCAFFERSEADGRWWRKVAHRKLNTKKQYISLQSVRRLLRREPLKHDRRTMEFDRVIIPHRNHGYADLVVTLK